MFLVHTAQSNVCESNVIRYKPLTLSLRHFKLLFQLFRFVDFYSYEVVLCSDIKKHKISG